MKILIPFLLLLTFCLVANEAIAKGENKGRNKCATIADGGLLDQFGETAVLGTDKWGYNYQARKFDGLFCDHIPYFRTGEPSEWCKNKRADVEMTIKWNDAWLSNKDCDDNGWLDSGGSSKGSGAWYISRLERKYKGENGEICEWSHFIKLVAPPVEAYSLDDTWYDESGKKLGPSFRNMILIKEVVHDPCKGIQGNQLETLLNNGLGGW